MFDTDALTQVYVPPGWPSAVPPPGADGWLHRAVAFLLDACPPEYRGYRVLRNHPVVLARLAHEHVEAQLTATRSQRATVRTSLAGWVDARVAGEAVEILQQEEARLLRLLRAVHLVEESLHDVRFVPKL